MEHWAVTLSERCYRTMLSLYPVAFRVRFRSEMAQLFRDSCREALRRDYPVRLLCFWVRALGDLFLSVARERGRILLNVRGLQRHATGLVDTTVILTIIIFHLLVAGAGLALYLPRTYETGQGFLLMTIGMGALLGGFGVMCSLVLARFRRVQYRLINL